MGTELCAECSHGAGSAREGSLEGAEAAAVQGKVHPMSLSSHSCHPHVAAQVTSRHCPSKCTLQALAALWEKGFDVISLKSRLAPCVLAEGKAEHCRNLLRTSNIAWSRENTQDWDLSPFIYLFHNISTIYCD